MADPARSSMTALVSRLKSPRQALSDAMAVLRARWYLRRASSVGPRVRLWGRPRVHNSGTMIIEDRVRLISTTATLELAAVNGGILRIGPGTLVNYGCSIAANARIDIGARCNLGTHVIIMDSDYHHVELERRNEPPPAMPIIIEDDVWLGARVIVLRGVTIGAGSVIGAASVVTRNIPPRSVAVGQPAKVIRTF